MVWIVDVIDTRRALAHSILCWFTTLCCIALTACEPVESVVEFDSWTFEGYQVYSYAPESPRGLVYLFHGSGGSAEFAKRLETIDVINLLIEHHYAFVATESSQRTDERRWQVNDASFDSNPDLARLLRLQAQLESRYAINRQTPLFGIGMSNGARMVSLFGQAFADAGLPVAAISPVMRTVATPVRQAGGLTVPALFILAENETVVPNTRIMADHAQLRANQIDSDLLIKAEEPLLDWRFTRIPSIERHEAEAIYHSALDSGIWNEEGSRIVSVSEALEMLATLQLPVGVSGDTAAVATQMKLILAVHQFSAFYRQQLVDFFNKHNPQLALAVDTN